MFDLFVLYSGRIDFSLKRMRVEASFPKCVAPLWSCSRSREKRIPKRDRVGHQGCPKAVQMVGRPFNIRVT